MARRSDPVTPELREYILKRDRICFGKRYDDNHKCFTRFRKPHPAWATNYLEIEHFHNSEGEHWSGGGAVMGDRAPSSPTNCVAICGLLNYENPSANMRSAMRDYVNEQERIE